MLDQLKVRNKVVGTRQTLKMVENGSAKIVFLAQDIDEDMRAEIENTCEAKQVSIFYVENMALLGRACGIKRKTASAACID